VQSTNDLMVVETEDDIFLGTLEVNGETVKVKTGLPGRPTILRLDDIEDLTPAIDHPDVVMA
jgi:hypothetical protein